jgi:transcription antitermination factor NusG
MTETDPAPAWYALFVRPRSERFCATLLAHAGLEEYVPLYRSKRQWSDRVKEQTLPLFPGYTFCRFDYSQLRRVLSSPGVIRILGIGPKPVAIPTEEIESIRILTDNGQNLHPLDQLIPGQRARVLHGPLKSVEGTIVQWKGSDALSVSITLLNRSVVVQLPPEAIEAIVPQWSPHQRRSGWSMTRWGRRARTEVLSTSELQANEV